MSNTRHRESDHGYTDSTTASPRDVIGLLKGFRFWPKTKTETKQSPPGIEDFSKYVKSRSIRLRRPIGLVLNDWVAKWSGTPGEEIARAQVASFRRAAAEKGK